jgi:hypothetical protein
VEKRIAGTKKWLYSRQYGETTENERKLQQRRKSMQQPIIHRLQMAIICIVGLALMVLATACAGVGNTSTASATTITGTLVSVNASQHSATVTVNGQQVTVSGLTDQQVAAIQPQVGKTYSLQVTGSGNAYTIVPNSNPVLSETETPQVNVTPTDGVTQQPTTFAPGSFNFMGNVRNVSASSLTVSMPNGKTLSMNITALTDRSHFGGGLPTTGQLIKVEASANADSSFTATKLDTTDASDVANQNIVQYKGLSTSAVGTDRVIHFKVGTQSYSFTIGATTDLSDVGGNVQAIQANQLVKVKVQYAGSSATVLKVELSNG